MAAILLGTAAFAGIGLFMAGTLRAEVNLAAANGLYLVLLLLGGMIVPITKLPSGLASFAKVLPAEALSAALHAVARERQLGPGGIVGRAGGMGGRGAARRRPHLPLGVKERTDRRPAEHGAARVQRVLASNARSSAVKLAGVSVSPRTMRAMVPLPFTNTALGSPSK